MRQRPQLDTKWAPLSRKQQPARTEGLADPSVHIQTWTLSDIFSKMNKISLPLQGKQLMLLVASPKTGAFQQKSEVCKTCVHDWGLESTSTCGHLSEDISGDSNRCDLWKKKTKLDVERRPCLEALPSWVTYYCTNDQRAVLLTHVWAGDSVGVPQLTKRNWYLSQLVWHQRKPTVIWKSDHIQLQPNHLTHSR